MTIVDQVSIPESAGCHLLIVWVSHFDDRTGGTVSEETNFYLQTLEGCRDTLIPGCKTAVHEEGSGSVSSSIATPLDDGGWTCTEATEWIGELEEHCKGILGAFDTAQDTVGAAATTERTNNGDKVEAGHAHGLAWLSTWRAQTNTYRSGYGPQAVI